LNLATLLLVFAVLLGATLGAFFRRFSPKVIPFLLTFSGAYLLGIGVFHLLPEVYQEHSHHYGLMIMAGFFVQVLLEAASKGLEHGHAHAELFHGKNLPLLVLFSLFLHAFIESIPVGSHADPISRRALLWGLLVHKVPVAIILYQMLHAFTANFRLIAFWLLAFAAMAPLGVLVGHYSPWLRAYSSELTAFVFGIFLHISTTILFESNRSHRFNSIKLGVILLALSIAWLSVAHH